MNNNRRSQIHSSLIDKDTEYLLDIWKNDDSDRWDDIVFEIVKEILIERIGDLPEQSIKIRFTKILKKVEDHLKKDEFDYALSECEEALQINPDSAIAYNFRGLIYEEKGLLEKAIINYQKAIQLDPKLKIAWKKMLKIENELKNEFEVSIARQHLEMALNFAYGNEPVKALEECEKVKSLIPPLAIAYNDLGVIYHVLGQFDLAMDAFLTACTLNPHYGAAQHNLKKFKEWGEEEQYLRISISDNDELIENIDTSTEFAEDADFEKISSIEPLPGWIYLDANAYFLLGWAGHRTRPGRSGYDPLESEFELAHIEGYMIRLILTRKFRTHNPIYLAFMTLAGLIYSSSGVFLFFDTGLIGIFAGFIALPYLIIGIMLLVNVYLSLFSKYFGECKDNGCAFF